MLLEKLIIYMLVDVIAGHLIFSCMDGFNNYNHIKVHPLNDEKTAFQTTDNFYYTIMLFYLKNAGTTYQRAMIATFHNMLYDCLEYYVDYISVNPN